MVLKRLSGKNGKMQIKWEIQTTKTYGSSQMPAINNRCPDHTVQADAK